jgi:hypothetical protein
MGTAITRLGIMEHHWTLVISSSEVASGAWDDVVNGKGDELTATVATWQDSSETTEKRRDEDTEGI